MSLQGLRILRGTLKLCRSDVLQSAVHGALDWAATLTYVLGCVVMYSDDRFTVLQWTEQNSVPFSYVRHTYVINAVGMFAFASV